MPRGKSFRNRQKDLLIKLYVSFSYLCNLFTLFAYAYPCLIGYFKLHKNAFQSAEQIVTSTLYVPSQGRLVLGHEDGSILIVYAAHALMKQLLDIKLLQKSPG